MINVDLCIEVLIEKFGDIPVSDENFFKGIIQYIEDNHFDSLSIDGKVAKKIISNVLVPITNMPKPMMVCYFMHYEDLKNINSISKQAFNAALDAYENKQDLSEIETIERKFLLLVTKLAMNKELEKTLASIISETILDIDYAKGNKDKMSMRLSRKVSS